MYKHNQIVEYHGRYGRVMFHNTRTHNVHVMFRLNTNTWKIERCDQIYCKPVQRFMWSTQSAFFTKHLMRTPQLDAFDMEVEDCLMEL